MVPGAFKTEMPCLAASPLRGRTWASKPSGKFIFNPVPIIFRSKGCNSRGDAKALRGLLEGEAGPYRDIVLLNAAAALVAAGHEEQVSDALARATVSIDSKKALHALETLIYITNKT